MSITTTRSVINIGTSKGITLPAKELKRIGVSTGDQVKVTISLANEPNDKLAGEYRKFVDQYGETLKNLADR